MYNSIYISIFVIISIFLPFLLFSDFFYFFPIHFSSYSFFFFRVTLPYCHGLSFFHLHESEHRSSILTRSYCVTVQIAIKVTN